MPAVIKVRVAAARSNSANNIKQICLAHQNYISSHGGRLPSPAGNEIGVLNTLLPYLDQDRFPISGFRLSNSDIRDNPSITHFAVFKDPSDPTVLPTAQFPTCYGPNSTLFHKERVIPGSFAGGTSNTIAFAQQYYGCRDENHSFLARDIGFAYVYPKEGITFQVQPLGKEKCECDVPQTPYTAGLTVGLVDGSVRTLSPNISWSTFWAAISPARGDALGNDWNP